MSKIYAVILLTLIGFAVCKADEYYCLVADDNTKFAIADIDYLLASDSEPTFNVVMKDGTVSGPITRATFGKEFYQESGITGREAATVTVFPNPVKEYLHVTGMGNEERDLGIYSINGACLRSIRAGGDGVTVFVGDLPEGKYLLRTDRSSMIFIKD